MIYNDILSLVHSRSPLGYIAPKAQLYIAPKAQLYIAPKAQLYIAPKAQLKTINPFSEN